MVIIVVLALFVIIVHGLLVRDGMPPEENVRNNSRMTKRKQSSKIEMDKEATLRTTNNEQRRNQIRSLTYLKFSCGARKSKREKGEKKEKHIRIKHSI